MVSGVAISGCTEVNAVLECTGELTGNSIDSDNSSIWFHDISLDATTGNQFVLNTTAGWINLTRNVTIDAAEGTGTSVDIRFYANSSEPILINGTLFDAFGGAGTDGSLQSFNAANCGNNFQGTSGGVPGNSDFSFQTGSEVIITNSTINAYGGRGGDGSPMTATDCAATCGSQAITGGTGFTGGYANFTTLIPMTRNNTFINSSAGAGGEGGDSENTGGGGWNAHGGNSGEGGSSLNVFTMSGGDLLLFGSDFLGYSGKFGRIGNGITGCISSTPGTVNKNGDEDSNFIGRKARFENMLLNLSVGDTSDKTGRSSNYFEWNQELIFINTTVAGLQPDTNQHIINLTNTTEDRIAFFNGTDFLQTHFVYCTAPDIIIGNDSALDSELDWTNCPSFQDNNITYVSQEVFFIEETLTLTINSPGDNFFSLLNLSASFTINSSLGNTFDNLTLIINGTINATQLNVVSGTTNVTNATGMPDGNYIWSIEACSNSTLCIQSTNRTFTIDSSNPIINFIEPGESGNSSVFNLTTNIEIQDATGIEDANYTVLYSNGTKFYTNNTSSPSSPFTFSDSVNFLEEDNYTINMTVNNSAGGTTSRITTYFFDTTDPLLTISEPTGDKTSRTITLNSQAIDNSSLTCFYRVTDSNLNPEIAKSPYDCVTDNFVVSSDGDFIIFANATDGLHSVETNSSFSVDTSAPVVIIEDTGGGGGGGDVPESPVCDIGIEPSSISVSTTNRLIELQITNNEDFSFDPEFLFEKVEDQKSFISELQITNTPETILQQQTFSLGLRYFGDSTEAGENNLVISNPNCKDINVAIGINKVIPGEVAVSFFDPDKSFTENVVEQLVSPIADFPIVNVIPVWAALLIIYSFVIILARGGLSKNLKANKNLSVLTTLFLLFLVTLFITFLLKLIFSLIGGSG